MTYAADEESQAAGAPLEGFEWVGSASTWRYTSAIEAVTIDGNSYTPLAGLIRSSIGVGTTQDTPTLTVTLPTSAQVVAHYAFATPPRSLTLNLYRYQAVSGEWVVAWTGEVASITAKGEVAEAVIPSALASRLSTPVPSLAIYGHCQHFLYDARCRVVRASFDLATTVASVSASGTTVTVAGVGGAVDHYYRAGEIVRDSDSERRSIISQIGTALIIAAPFRTIAAPNPVTLYAGCDHQHATCTAKFANLANFGGFPTMPSHNPFRVPIRLGGG